MALTPEDDQREGAWPGAALFDALREDAVQDALHDIEAGTGLTRERAIAEAVIFAGRERRAFLAHLRGRPSRERELRPKARLPRLLVDNSIEIVVGGMFLLGAALAAIQLLLG